MARTLLRAYPHSFALPPGTARAQLADHRRIDHCHRRAGWHSFEPLVASLFGSAYSCWSPGGSCGSIAPTKQASRRFADAAHVPGRFLGYFYDLAKTSMDAERAKKYFPLNFGPRDVLFFANVAGPESGMPGGDHELTSPGGCGDGVRVFNVDGLMTNGWGYGALAGPVLVPGP